MTRDTIGRVVSALRVLTDDKVIDSLQGRTSSKASLYWACFGAGLALGGGAGILLSPVTGKKARGQIAELLTEVRGKLDGMWEEGELGHLTRNGAHGKNALNAPKPKANGGTVRRARA